MANLSDVDVKIVAQGVGKELLEYIDTINEDVTINEGVVYPIVYSGYEVSSNGDEVIIEGASSGRWAYHNNLEGYFDPSRVTRWLGVDANIEYMSAEAQEKFRSRAEKYYKAYIKLMDAMKEKDGTIDIEYADMDPSLEWIGNGCARVFYDGEMKFKHSFEDEDFTISNVAKMQGEDEVWALGYLYGEEVADAYEKYVEQWKKDHSDPKFKGMEYASPDEWYDNEYKED